MNNVFESARPNVYRHDVFTECKMPFHALRSRVVLAGIVLTVLTVLIVFT